MDYRHCHLNEVTAKVARHKFEEESMTAGGTLSCPIKLPPLDSYTVSTQNATPRREDNAPPQVTKTNIVQNDFHAILTGMRASSPSPTPQSNVNEAVEAGRMVESFLLALVFKHAFNTSLSPGIFGNSYESRMYLDMFIDATAEEACRTSGLGIADMIVADINRRADKQETEDVENATEELQGMRQSDVSWRHKEAVPGMHRKTGAGIPPG